MVIWYVNPPNNDGNYEMTIINSCFQLLTTTLLCIRCDAIGPASVNPQMVWPWKLQSSHLDSSNIFQKVLSHSPVSWSTGWGWEDLVRAVGPGISISGLRWWCLWGCRDVKVKSRSFWPRMATVRNRSLWTNTNYSTRFRTRLQAFTNVYSCAQIVSKATRTKTSLLFFSGVQIVLSIVLQFSVQHRNMFHYVPFIYGSKWWTINSSILPAFIAQTSQHLVYLPFPPGPHHAMGGIPGPMQPSSSFFSLIHRATCGWDHMGSPQLPQQPRAAPRASRDIPSHRPASYDAECPSRSTETPPSHRRRGGGRSCWTRGPRRPCPAGRNGRGDMWRYVLSTESNEVRTSSRTAEFQRAGDGWILLEKDSWSATAWAWWRLVACPDDIRPIHTFYWSYLPESSPW